MKWIYPVNTLTSYTSSVDRHVTVSKVVSVTAVDQKTFAVQAITTLVVTQTSTISRPAVKTSPLSRRDLDDRILFARIETNRVASTTYVTVITTDSFFCINNPSDVECTNSTQGVLTKTLKTTVRVTSTVPNSKQAVVTKSGVVTSTTIKTITAAQATQAPGEISVASASISQAPGSSSEDTTRTAPVNSPSLTRTTSIRQSTVPTQSPNVTPKPSSSIKETPTSIILSMMIACLAFGVTGII
ncbi:uncharacterized protein RSE6_02217 [Rhynchosporium secalis]|uniref:Uncharacterized protein n=1 Tax=Rhynchosporium secalis TaxID=38038 RepID=A0A1E1LZT4_RHYSE|nr:uncharacterized protein RSE6_02217 [Rhynchosporium secalis]